MEMREMNERNRQAQQEAQKKKEEELKKEWNKNYEVIHCYLLSSCGIHDCISTCILPSVQGWIKLLSSDKVEIME